MVITNPEEENIPVRLIPPAVLYWENKAYMY